MNETDVVVQDHGAGQVRFERTPPTGEVERMDEHPLTKLGRMVHTKYGIRYQVCC